MTEHGVIVVRDTQSHYIKIFKYIRKASYMLEVKSLPGFGYIFYRDDDRKYFFKLNGDH